MPVSPSEYVDLVWILIFNFLKKTTIMMFMNNWENKIF